MRSAWEMPELNELRMVVSGEQEDGVEERQRTVNFHATLKTIQVKRYNF